MAEKVYDEPRVQEVPSGEPTMTRKASRRAGLFEPTLMREAFRQSFVMLTERKAEAPRPQHASQAV